jgi:hypothetical protein
MISPIRPPMTTYPAAVQPRVAAAPPPAASQAAPPPRASSDLATGLEGFFTLVLSPVTALVGAGGGALIARLAGRAASSGGAIGAIVGGVAVSLFFLAQGLRWHMNQAQVLQKVITIGGVLGGAGIGFMAGGPVGAMIGAILGSMALLPMGYLLGPRLT